MTIDMLAELFAFLMDAGQGRVPVRGQVRRQRRRIQVSYRDTHQSIHHVDSSRHMRVYPCVSIAVWELGS